MTDPKNLRLKDLDCLDNMLLQCFMSGTNLQQYPRACIEYLSLMLDAGASPDAKNRFNHPLSIVLTKLSAFPDTVSRLRNSLSATAWTYPTCVLCTRRYKTSCRA